MKRLDRREIKKYQILPAFHLLLPNLRRLCIYILKPLSSIHQLPQLAFVCPIVKILPINVM